MFPYMSERKTDEAMIQFFSAILNQHEGAKLSHDFFSANSEPLIPAVSALDTFIMLNKMKMSDYDTPSDIPASIYVEFASLLADPISHLINLSLKNALCFNQWKKGYLIPLPKLAVPLETGHIRPIVLLSALGKLVEKIIANFLLPQIISKIDTFQFGCLPHRSASQYIAVYLHKALSHLEKKNTAVISLLTDFRKAFDNVDHAILLNKMDLLGVHHQLIAWIFSFLSGRALIVKNGNRLSHEFTFSNGLPQGSVLGGLLYIIMVNGLMNNSSFNMKYVDDMSIMLFSDGLPNHSPQHTMNDFIHQATVSKLPINIEKCMILFHSFSRSCIKPEIIIDNFSLPIVEYASILGFQIQANFKWSLQINKIVKTTNSRLRYLYCLRNIGLDIRCLVLVYISIIRPCLEYGAEIWGAAITSSQSNRLESVQKRSLKIILQRRYLSYDQALNFAGLQALTLRRSSLKLKAALKFFNQLPQFKPPSRLQISGILTRHSNNLVLPKARTERLDRSPILQYIKAINCS